MNGKQLKNSILQWAIQGKLVPQNPKDEPACKLLDRIAAAKNGDCASPECHSERSADDSSCHSERSAKGTKSKNLAKKKSAQTSRIYREGSSWFEQIGSAEPKDITDEIPFDIPESWEWCRLGNLIFPPKYGTSSKSSPSGEMIVLRMGNIQNGEVVYDKLVYSNNRDDNEKYLLQKNDLLFNRTNSAELVGKTAIYRGDRPAIYAGYIILLRPILNIAEYLNYTMGSPYVRDYCKDVKTIGVQQCNINAEKISQLYIPLPPLAEQKRIVEKLEKVLPLVDEYDSAQVELDKLNAALPETLKKSLLQEAIQGKLVPQNPKDEPASKLLERIVSSRHSEQSEAAPACHPERSAKGTKSKDLATKAKKKFAPTSRIYREGSSWYEQIGTAEPTDITDQIPFDIPETWEWCRLGNFISITTGLAYKKEDLDVKSEDSVRVLRGGNIDYGKWMKKDDDVIIASKFVNPDLFLKKGMFITPAVTSLEQMGKTALVECDQENVVVGGFVMMLSSCFNDESFLMYLLNFFQSYYYKQFCQSITNKSGQAFYNLSRQKLLQGLVPIPPLAEQKRIVAKLEQLFKQL